MGQYHYICNIDRREFLHPHKFGDGLKLLEFGASGQGTMLGLAVLLAASNNRGGGDLRTDDDQFVGRWAGDRIAIIGDYYEPQDVYEYPLHPCRTNGPVQAKPIGNDNPWSDEYGALWTDISAEVIGVLNAGGERVREGFGA